MAEKLGFANGYPTVVIDLGNALVKIGAPMSNGQYEYGTTKHACVEIDEARYARLVHEYGDRKGHYEYIKWNGRFFVVGEAALSEGDVKPVQGRNKYSRDYYGIIFISTLLKIYHGKVPEKINAFLGYPPSDFDFINDLMKSVIGNWNFDNLGRKITLRVEHASVFDEIVGGVHNVILDEDGNRVRLDKNTKGPALIAKDGPSIVCDLGGRTFDIVRLTKTGEPDYRVIASRGIGVNDAVEQFKRVFEMRHKDVLRDAENGLPLERIYECFADPQKRVRVAGSKYVECMDIYTQSTTRLVNEVKDAYRDMSRGSISHNYALLTGGGTGSLYEELSKSVFYQFYDAGALFLAADRPIIHQANVRGAVKMIPALIEASKRRVRMLASGK